MGALSQGARAGFALGNTNPLTDVIRGILSNARAKGLINTQADANIRLATAKSELEPKTKGATTVIGGRAVPVLGAEGDAPAVFPTNEKIITPSESTQTADEAAMSELIAQRIRARTAEADAASRATGGGETNIIQRSAAGTATPASNIVAQQQQEAPQQQAPQRSTEEEELLRLLDALEQ
jgi:hypothetical protein